MPYKGTRILDAFKNEIINLYELKQTTYEIAKHFNVCRETVLKLLRENGITIRTTGEDRKLAWDRSGKRSKPIIDAGPYRACEERAKLSTPEQQTVFGFLSEEPSRRCPKCGKSVPRSGWSKMLGKGQSAYCKVCFNITYNRKKRIRDEDAKTKRHINEKIRYQELKQQVIIAYGGACACCGETIPEFMEIDHALGGGKRHRTYLKSIGIHTTNALCSWIKKRGFPPEFRILCRNCNFAHGIYGYCPHEEKRSFLDVPYRSLWRRKLRLRLIEGYGGKCACCGETMPEFLALDHVHGGGRQHELQRKADHVSNGTFYLQVIKDGFPPDYRILCANCNGSRGYHGYCPHLREQ